MWTPDEIKQQIDELDRELVQLDAKRKRRELLAEILKTFPESGVKKAIKRYLAVAAKPYAGLSISEAILRFLEERSGEYLWPSEIRKGILAGGITSQANRFSTVVIMACKRLEEGGKLYSDVKGEFKAYRFKPPSEE